MTCGAGNSDYEELRSAIQNAMDRFAEAHPEQNVSVNLTVAMPSEQNKTAYMMTTLVSGNTDMTEPEPIEIDSFPPENDGRDPGRDLMSAIRNLGTSGHRKAALELAETGVERFPTSAFAYQCLAFALATNYKQAEAQDALKTAGCLLDDADWVKDDPETAVDQRLMLASYLMAFRDLDGAREQANRAIQAAEAAGLNKKAEQARSLLLHLTSKDEE